MFKTSEAPSNTSSPLDEDEINELQSNPIKFERAIPRSRGFSSSPKPGMEDLQRIVLDLYRDVVRVKNAISPSGAESIVEKHNKNAKPSAKWHLAKINPNGPATIENMPDINKDGVPDVIIRNSKGNPMYINGYTTKRSDYPETLSYYNAYPTRKDRKGHPKNEYLRDELYNEESYNDIEHPEDLGNLRYTKPDWYDNAYEKGYKLKNLNKNRMGPFRRFQTYIVKPRFENFLESAELTGYPKKGPLLAKVTGGLWSYYIVGPLAQLLQIQENEIEKFKKSKQFKELADNDITNLLHTLSTDREYLANFDDKLSNIASEALDTLGN